MQEAEKHGINATTDSAGNVIMRKEATPGMESRRGIILQAHMDMVPQKNSDKKFDFAHEAIQAYIEEGWVTADGTTLGADNGMGVAAILSVMESTDLPHGPLEALITTSEETGMHGARGLKGGVLKGDILVNLDSETEGELYVGCAGGLDASVAFRCQMEPTPADHHALKITIKGLKGGHSGIDIHLGRANANLLLIRLLKMGEVQFGARLSSIDGGGLRNAIPREASATVVVPQTAVAHFETAIREFEKIIEYEYKGVDEGLSVHVETVASPATVIDANTQWRMIRAVHACPNGVIQMSASMPGVVQTSSNLARIVLDKGEILVHCLLRSSVNSEKADLGDRIASVFELSGAQVALEGGYDGWNPNMESPILHTMTQSYQKLFGHAPAVVAIHAGLECGIISSNYPDLDMISFGPTIRHPHSPDEKVEIASVERFWNYLTDTLRNAPFKA